MPQAGAWPRRLAEAARAGPAPLGRPRRLRPSLLDLYLVRGVVGPFLIILVAVGAAMMLERALRLVYALAGRGADLGYFFPILGQLVPYYLDLAIPAAFMVALVLLVARLDDRLELEAMLASGLSLGRIAAPLVALGLVIAAAELITGGWLEPLGRYGVRTLSAEAVNAGRIGRLQPGAFYQPAESLALTFDSRTAEGGIGGIFLWERLADGRELVLTGRRGRIGFAPQGRDFAIEIADGLHVADSPGRSAPQRFSFDSMTFRESLQLRETGWQRGWDQKEMTVPELAAALDTPPPGTRPALIEAELYGRLARAAMIPLIPLIVLPLAFTTKKGRRGLGLLLGGLVLALLHHGLNLAKGLIRDGVVAPRPTMLAVSLAGAALVLLVFLSGRHLPSHSPIHAVLKPIGAAVASLRSAALLRLPQGRWGVLALYLARRLLQWTLLSLAGMVLLLQMVELLERADDITARGLGMAGIGRYLWLQLPLMLQHALPLAALAGAMVVFIDLARSSEMTAVRAAGISQWRILATALPVPLVLSIAAFGLAEHAVPRSQAALAGWWAETAPRDGPQPGSRWFRAGGEIVRAAAASPDGRALTGVTLFRRDPGGLLAERLAAASATAGDGGWTLHNVARTDFEGDAPATERIAQLAWPARLEPDDVAAFFAAVPTLSSAAARRALGQAAPVSRSESFFATRILRSAAEPLAPIIMLLLALPLAFIAPRTGVAWPATLYAAGGGLLYVVADGVLTVFAQVGYLPATVGAWAAPAFVALAGLTVLLYSER